MGPGCFVSTCGQLSPVYLVFMSVSSMLSLKGNILRGYPSAGIAHIYIYIYIYASGHTYACMSSLRHDHYIMGELLGSYRATFDIIVRIKES